MRPRAICPNARIQSNFLANRLADSTLKSLDSIQSISNAIFTVGTAKSFRVDEGTRNHDFVLRYQGTASTIGGNLVVNLWVQKVKYEDQFNDNYLNTTTHTSSFGRISDRDTMLQEMGDLMVQDIVPSTVSAFGVIRPITGATSEGLNVLIYDICSPFGDICEGGAISGNYVGGYFDPEDKVPGGNRMNVIHMDLYPSNPGGAPLPLGFESPLPRKDFYHVLAHELQHLIHSQFDDHETIWMNEGISQFAIYRVFHGKKFQNGNPILNSPSDAPSQVEFWLQDPTYSLLMTGDEPGVQGGFSQRTDSAEIRGLGYLFFTYLWEALGGKVGIGGGLDPGGADQAFRSMVASTSRGIASLEPTLNQNAKSFKDLFSRFAFGLIEETSSIAPFEFFDYHSDGFRQAFLNLNSSSEVRTNLKPNAPITRTVDTNFTPISFQLSGYEFMFQQFTGAASSSSSLELTSSREFDIYTFSNESGNWKLTGFSQSSNYRFWISRSETILTILVNPALETTTIQASFLGSLTNGGTAPAEDLNDTELNLGGTLSSISLGAQSITSQRFINSTSFIVDLLNDSSSEVDIRKCLANQTCVQASHQSISSDPVARRIRSKSVTIGATNYFYSYLQLQPGQSYDLFYANHSNKSLSLSPVPTRASDLFTDVSGETTPTGSVPVVFASRAGGGGGCFLASAAFLGPDGPEVKLLSRFRDQFLLTHPIGRAFVGAYYTYSPQVAQKIQESRSLRGLTQVLLLPLLVVAYVLENPLLSVILILSLLLIRFGGPGMPRPLSNKRRTM
jgi:hypothetical protein